MTTWEQRIDNGVVPYVDLCPARNSANKQARVTRLHLKAESWPTCT